MQAHACHGTGVEVRGYCSGLVLTVHLVEAGSPRSWCYAGYSRQSSLAPTSTLTIGVLELHMHGTTCGFLSFY